MNEILRNKIWEEIKETLGDKICANKYADLQERLNLIYKILIPLMSATCSLLSFLEHNIPAMVIAILTFLISVVKAFGTKLILTEKKIEHLHNLCLDFDKLLDDMEQLFWDYDNGRKDDDGANEKFNELKEQIRNPREQLNRLVLYIPGWVDNNIT